METLPQCDFFLNANREDREKRGKEKLHSLKGDEDTDMATELPKKKPQNKLENIVQEGIAYWGRLFVSHFFKAPQRGDISRNCCYLYIHSLLFQSMTNR